MAEIIGTIRSETLRGVVDGQADLIWGDTNAPLSSGRSGDDLILTVTDPNPSGDFTTAFGDALVIEGTGRGGHDRLIGSVARDVFHGDAGGLMRGNAIGGNDFLGGNGGEDELRGDANVIGGNARGGNDTLSGGGDSDTLYGDANDMAENARGGADRLDGGGGDDNLFGDALTMSDQTVGGNDRLAGGEGDDSLTGDAQEIDAHGDDSLRCGDDTLRGGEDNDEIFGDAQIGGGEPLPVICGNDRLFGDTGVDTMFGDIRVILDGHVAVLVTTAWKAALAAEPASDEKRKTLARLRELVDAAEFTRKNLVATLQKAAGIETDQLVLMARPGRVQIAVDEINFRS